MSSYYWHEQMTRIAAQLARREWLPDPDGRSGREWERQHERMGDAAIALRDAADAAQAEVRRLSGWLERIDGGDSPCDDAAALRRMAYEALTLGREGERC